MSSAKPKVNDVKPDSASSKTPQASESSKGSPEPRKKKKKKPKNGTTSSTNSKDGDSKAPKKKNPKTDNKNLVDDSGIIQSPKTKARKVQVKQRSFTTLLDTGSSKIAVGDVVTDVEIGVPVDDAGGFASGNYGVLLETKRAENLCISLALQKTHVESMLDAFKREEQIGDGFITTGEFFSMIHEQPRQLTKGIFEAVGLASDLRKMRFDDFVLCVATIATWSKSELLYYAFKQFDVDESGVMDGRELRAFCEGLKNDSSFYFAKNVNTAREKLALREHHQLGRRHAIEDIEANTIVDLENLAKGSAEFQLAFYPLVQFQQNVRSCALGERFWAGVAQRRHDVEVIVHYMRMHNGKLPSFSLLNRIIAYLLPYSQANTQLAVHRLAVLKYAEEERIWQEQAHARAEAAKMVLTDIQEENQTPPDR